MSDIYYINYVLNDLLCVPCNDDVSQKLSAIFTNPWRFEVLGII